MVIDLMCQGNFDNTAYFIHEAFLISLHFPYSQGNRSLASISLVVNNYDYLSQLGNTVKSLGAKALLNDSTKFHQFHCHLLISNLSWLN